MKKFLLIAFLPLFTVSLAQPPAGYYNAATGLNGTALQSALHNIIDNHNVQSYNSLHDCFETTDRKSNGTVWDMYSDNPGGNPPYVFNFTSGDQCGSYNGEGDCYNREHSWPKSWFNDMSPMYSDLFHLYPTDGYVNGRRSNYPYGTVSSPSWVSENGCRLGDCSYPGYSGTVFEPIDEYKGDFARTYFYMSTRYYNEDNGWPGSDMVNGSQLRPWALSMLKEWHLSDPVSQKEFNRNNAVYNYQQNRNPFIDHPEFVSQIWGGPTAVAEISYNTDINIYPVPAIDYVIIDHHGYYNQDKLCISVTDVTGRKYDPKISGSEISLKINVSCLIPGFYLVTLNEPGKLPAFARLIK
ncbi:MAG: endonuclease [Bacteroidales bacterium]|nr:endonuclease [Bacteroidales bacterium]MBK9356018.1 endonuclease [Bacteroidales bacterium]